MGFGYQELEMTKTGIQDENVKLIIIRFFANEVLRTYGNHGTRLMELC